MKFYYKNFSCDTEIYYKDKDIIVRFYNSSKEQKEDDIINLVIVDPGFGYLCLKYKGDAALLSGFLDEDVFTTDDYLDAAITFIENISPTTKTIYTPYHITRFKQTSYMEYNGEY
ncbi:MULTISPECIES: hypothetical protein [unclassified Paenibacillus]|uniref:hypothetical protein n=1 Tax=unclassified Paenibacillus TaxID=185978 RepID=UPI0009A7B0E5|nr:MULTISPECIES: hypothetical protein [unclassified Paenibacillus]SLK12932.1 hypothetical protein SAMN06272722_10818 [Paenibacillus sp. RU5A]SOC72763.1 hypothetical protein SAMN05880581_10818 [Paenibacillus sp. RU26A]SOC75042.1 hypothetical protein SAMN05880586_10818 [Paenibacillus sp. RU5M]